jgi:hypothetical protein
MPSCPRVRSHFGIVRSGRRAPREVPGGREVWRRVRARDRPGDLRGLSIGVGGHGFIAASVARDLAAPTSARCWPGTSGASSPPLHAPAPPPTPRSPRRAPHASPTPEPDWARLREAHDRDDGFRVPSVVTSFTARGPARVPVDVDLS